MNDDSGGDLTNMESRAELSKAWRWVNTANNPPVSAFAVAIGGKADMTFAARTSAFGP
jgi:hypothetical protein